MFTPLCVKWRLVQDACHKSKVTSVKGWLRHAQFVFEFANCSYFNTQVCTEGFFCAWSFIGKVINWVRAASVGPVEWESDFAVRTLLQEQFSLAVKEENAECSVQSDTLFNVWNQMAKFFAFVTSCIVLLVYKDAKLLLHVLHLHIFSILCWHGSV